MSAMANRRKAPALIRHKGKARVTPLRERPGARVTGFQIETKDGRMAGVVRPDTVRQKFSISRGEQDG